MKFNPIKGHKPGKIRPSKRRKNAQWKAAWRRFRKTGKRVKADEIARDCTGYLT